MADFVSKKPHRAMSAFARWIPSRGSIRPYLLIANMREKASTLASVGASCGMLATAGAVRNHLLVVQI